MSWRSWPLRGWRRGAEDEDGWQRAPAGPGTSSAAPCPAAPGLQQPGLDPDSLRLGEAIYRVLGAAGYSDQAVVGTVYALLTYILGFVALVVPRAGTDPQTSDEFVRRLHGFFAALPPGEFPHTVRLAPLLARISTDDQYRFGIRTFIAGLDAQTN